MTIIRKIRVRYFIYLWLTPTWLARVIVIGWIFGESNEHIPICRIILFSLYIFINVRKIKFNKLSSVYKRKYSKQKKGTIHITFPLSYIYSQKHWWGLLWQHLCYGIDKLFGHETKKYIIMNFCFKSNWRGHDKVTTHKHTRDSEVSSNILLKKNNCCAMRWSVMIAFCLEQFTFGPMLKPVLIYHAKKEESKTKACIYTRMISCASNYSERCIINLLTWDKAKTGWRWTKLTCADDRTEIQNQQRKRNVDLE